MKSMKTKLLRLLNPAVLFVDSIPSFRNGAFFCGFQSTRVPRFVRRLAVGSNLHRFWLRGSITKKMDGNGFCYNSDGRQLPFRIDVQHNPLSVPPEIYLALSTMLLAFVTMGFLLSLRPFFAV